MELHEIRRLPMPWRMLHFTRPAQRWRLAKVLAISRRPASRNSSHPDERTGQVYGSQKARWRIGLYDAFWRDRFDRLEELLKRMDQ